MSGSLGDSFPVTFPGLRRRNTREAGFLSTVIVHGLVVCDCASALRNNRLAAAAFRRADSKKSMV